MIRHLVGEGDIAKLRHGGVAFAQALRGLGVAAGAEGQVEERFDGSRVFGPLWFDLKHGINIETIRRNI